MKFGSDEMLELLLCAKEDKFFEDLAMMEMYNSVKAYTYYKLKTGFAKGELKNGMSEINTEYIMPYEYEEILSDVIYAVLKSLDGFLINAKNGLYSAAQRQAWLKNIIYFVILNYLKKRNKITIPIDITDHDSISDGSFDRLDETLIAGDSVRRIIDLACSMKSKPEIILAYILNKVVFSELMNSNLNGVSTYVSDFMYGKSLFEIKNLIICYIKNLYNVRIYKEMYPIIMKVGDDAASALGKKICYTTSNDISNWTNRMKDRMMLHKNEFSY